MPKPIRTRTLSPKQSEIAQLLAAGHSNREIAAKLGAKEQTIKNHVHGIYTKLGVSRRSEVIIMKFKGKL